MVAKVGCLVVMVSLLLAGSQSSLAKEERRYFLLLPSTVKLCRL